MLTEKVRKKLKHWQAGRNSLKSSLESRSWDLSATLTKRLR